MPTSSATRRQVRTVAMTCSSMSAGTSSEFASPWSIGSTSEVQKSVEMHLTELTRPRRCPSSARLVCKGKSLLALLVAERAVQALTSTVKCAPNQTASHLEVVDSAHIPRPIAPHRSRDLGTARISNGGIGACTRPGRHREERPSLTARRVANQPVHRSRSRSTRCTGRFARRRPFAKPSQAAMRQPSCFNSS